MGFWIRLLAVIFVGMTFTGSLAAAERAAHRAGCQAKVTIATAAPDADAPGFDGARLLFCQVASSILPSFDMALRAPLQDAADAGLASVLPFRAVSPRERPPRSEA